MQFGQGPSVKATYGHRQKSNTPRASQQIASFSSAFAVVSGSNTENLEPIIQNQRPPLQLDTIGEVTNEKALGKRETRSNENEVPAEKGRKRRNCAVDASRR